MKELDKVLDTNENILWEGKPSFWPFFFGRSLPTTIFSTFWAGVMVTFTITSWVAQNPLKPLVFLTPHFWIGLLILLGPMIYTVLVFKHTYYAITDKRVIIQKDLMSDNFEMINLDQITRAEVLAGVFDQWLGRGNTGSLLIFTAGAFTMAQSDAAQRPHILKLISNPYDLLKFFVRPSRDLKTDAP